MYVSSPQSDKTVTTVSAGIFVSKIASASASGATKWHWGLYTVDRYALQGGQTLSFYAIDLYQYQDEYQDIGDSEQEATFIEQHGEYLGSLKLHEDDTWKVV